MHTFASRNEPKKVQPSASFAKPGREFQGQCPAVRSLLHAQRTIGNGAVEPRLQRKLRVNAPGDPQEQQADRIAEQVVSTPTPHLERAKGGDGSEGQHEKASREPLAAARSGALDAGGMEAPPLVEEVLQSPGHPLGQAARDFMEPRFGQDFGDVRVHTDSRAAESAQAVGARAYTVGRDIVFAPGEYDADGRQGQTLLAHELTHTIQQSSPASERAPSLARKPDSSMDPHVAQLAQTAIEELDGRKSKKVLISTLLAAARLSELPAFAAILRAARDETFGDHFVFLISEMEEDFGSSSTVSVLQLFADAGVSLNNLNASLEPLAAVAKFKSLAKQFRALLASGDLSEEESQQVRKSIAEAEDALRAIEGGGRKPGGGPRVQQAGAGGVAVAAGWAWRAAGVLAADDATGIGVADDVLIPFVILGAAALSAIALFSGGPKPQMLDYGPAMAKVAAALREITALLGVSTVLMANVADTGIMEEVHKLLAAAVAAGAALTICAALEQLMAAAKRAGNTERMNKIKATQKAKGCRHSRHS